MIAYLGCFLNCLKSSGFLPLISVLTALLVSLSLSYTMTRHATLILSAQGVMSLIMPSMLALMDCSMQVLLWAYVGIVLTGIMLLSMVKYHISKRLTHVMTPPPCIRKFAGNLGVDVSVLNWSRLSAFTHRKHVYLSATVVRMLEPSEVRAVIAHEAYHARSGHNRMLASFLRISSLTFIRHRDEYEADEFAAKVVGAENLENALIKLNVVDYQKRMAALRGPSKKHSRKGTVRGLDATS